MKKTIWTHVSAKALKGMQKIFGEVYIWPVPYKRSDGRDGWTVVTFKRDSEW